MKRNIIISSIVALATLSTTACEQATSTPAFPMWCQRVVAGVASDPDETEFLAWTNGQYVDYAAHNWYNANGERIGFSYAEDDAICVRTPANPSGRTPIDEPSFVSTPLVLDEPIDVKLDTAGDFKDRCKQYGGSYYPGPLCVDVQRSPYVGA